MKNKTIPPLKIGDLTIHIPIIQGGMGVGISMAKLAAAVANEGAVGVISSIGLGLFDKTPNTDYFEANKIALRNEIRKARKLTNGVLGVNLMCAITDFDDMLQVSVDENIDIIFLGAGLPLRNMPKKALEEGKIKFVPIVSSARAANLICTFWEKHYGRYPDAFVIEGFLAGGHLGFKIEQINDPAFSLENILAEVLAATKSFKNRQGEQIPLIVAGGIFSGADIYKFMQLGAKGVQMGTRFVVTEECDADIAFKKAYIECKESDIAIIESPVGLPGRVIKNQFIKDVLLGIKKPFKCPKKCLKTCDFKKAPYCICSALYHAKLGNLKEGFAFAGHNAFRVDKIVSVKELIASLIKEYQKAATS